MSEFGRANGEDEAGVQVTRRRRRASRALGGGRAMIAAGAISVLLAGAAVTYAATEVFGHNQVGTEYPNGIQVSDDQIIKPLGDRLVTQTGKFMGSTVSPNGRYLAATSADKSVALQIFDMSSYKEIWSVGTAAGANQKFSNATVGQEGPTYSPDSRYLWVPEQDAVTRFPVNADGTLGAPTTFAIPKVDGRSALVGQIKYSPDGARVYAAINGQNTVVAMDPNSGAVTQTWKVGIAPRELAFVGDRLYVSNEGGRQARPGETTMDSYGSAVPANGYYGTSTTGSVSVIDTSNPSAPAGSIAVGLHPTAMFFQPDVAAAGKRNARHRHGGALFVANAFSDTVSVIDTKKDKVVQTIATDPWPSSDTGYAPTSIAMADKNHLLVTLGRANAVAVYQYNGKPQQPVNYIGLLPTDYYPATVATVGRQIVVTNTRGIDARGPNLSFNKGPGTTVAVGHGTHSTTASLTRFTLPRDRDISRVYTDRVFAQNGWGKNDVQRAKGHKSAPVAVPTRVGDPSTIKHVFLLVKENRTYDQVYGDMSEGDGDPSLAQFGAKVTPNQHALAKQFGLYDNLYDVGTNSAEGHNWLMQGDDPEYTESSAGEYQRSYDTEEDVLGHQRSGFLWTAVEDANNSARNYGEFEFTEGKPSGTWQQYYCAYKGVEAGGDPAQLTTPELKGNYGSVIPSLNAIADHLSPPFDTSIPDMYRYEIWKQDFQQNGPANFNMMWLSSDHTGGTADPEAQVADGDLAVGKIVDTISAQPVLEGLRDLRGRGRQPGRRRSRRRPPRSGPGHQPVRAARRGRQHLLLADHHGAHDRADPRRPAAEPEARRGDADVRRVHQHAGPHAVQRGAEPGAADRGRRHPAGLRPGHAGPEQHEVHDRGSDPAACGARERGGHRRGLADLARQAAHDRQRCGPRLREPGADEPVHVVPDAQLEGPVSG